MQPRQHSQLDISYIVSAYDRPGSLRTLLASLADQTHSDFEVIVTDNASDQLIAERQKALVVGMDDKRFRYVRTYRKVKVGDCYWSSEYGMKLAQGRWLCFPCDDVYYPPQWAQRMLGEAVRNNWDLALCEMVLAGPETCGTPGYFVSHIGTMSIPGYKPSFLVKASKFAGWVNKPTMTACSGVDRTTLQYMVRKPEIRWGACRDLAYVHN